MVLCGVTPLELGLEWPWQPPIEAISIELNGPISHKSIVTHPEQSITLQSWSQIIRVIDPACRPFQHLQLILPHHFWIESLKKALAEVKHGITMGPVAPMELIPHPCGTPGQKGFQLQSEMGINECLYKKIHVHFLSLFSLGFFHINSIIGFCENFNWEIQFGSHGHIQAPMQCQGHSAPRHSQDSHILNRTCCLYPSGLSQPNNKILWVCKQVASNLRGT